MTDIHNEVKSYFLK